MSSLAQINTQSLCKKRSITHNKNRLISCAYHGGIHFDANLDLEFGDEIVSTTVSRSKELSVLLSPMVAYAPQIPFAWILSLVT